MKKQLIFLLLFAILLGCSTDEVIQTVKITGVVVSPTSKTVVEGESFTITATVSPADADNKSVNWSSSAPAVASVDNNGKVTALTPGSATITATTVDGAKTATCEVTVKAPDLKLSTETVNLKVDESATVSITSGSGSYTVKSDNSSIATVTISVNTVTIKGVAVGGTIVQVNDEISQQKKYINVVVTRDNDTGTGGVSDLEGENY